MPTNCAALAWELPPSFFRAGAVHYQKGEPVFAHRFFEGGKLPDHLVVNDRVIPFKTDFRAWLRYEHLLSEDMPDDDKAVEMIGLVIEPGFDHGVTAADLICAASWFHSCADIERMSVAKIPKRTHALMAELPRYISPFWDFRQLWASFKKQHGIDLYSCGEMHWWEFLSLFEQLDGKTPYIALKELRAMTEGEFMGDEKLEKKARKKRWNAVYLEQARMTLPR